MDDMDHWISKAVAVALTLTVLSIFFCRALAATVPDGVVMVGTGGMVLASFWASAPWHTFRVGDS